jgi:hypothetical protein
VWMGFMGCEKAPDRAGRFAMQDSKPPAPWGLLG